MKNLSSPSQNVLPKNYTTPPPEKVSIPLKRRSSITPPPSYIPITTLQMFFSLSNFFYLKKPDNAQLCTGKIEAIPSNNIEDRP